MTIILIKELTPEEISHQYGKKLLKLKSRNMIAVSDFLYENQDKETPIMEICFATGLIRKKVIEVVGELKRRHGFIINNANYKNPRYQLLGFGNKTQRSSSVLELVKPKLNPLIEKVFS